MSIYIPFSCCCISTPGRSARPRCPSAPRSHPGFPEHLNIEHWLPWKYEHCGWFFFRLNWSGISSFDVIPSLLLALLASTAGFTATPTISCRKISTRLATNYYYYYWPGGGGGSQNNFSNGGKGRLPKKIRENVGIFPKSGTPPPPPVWEFFPDFTVYFWEVSHVKNSKNMEVGFG